MATEVAITGTLEPGPGAANTGSILAVPTHVMYDAAGGVLVTLDGVEDALTTITGAFSLDLYANTDPTTNPTGTGYWFYHVSTNGKKRRLNTLPIIVPHDAGATLQLADLAEASEVELFGYASDAALADAKTKHTVSWFQTTSITSTHTATNMPWVWTAPFACTINYFALISSVGGLALSASDYWTVELRRYRAGVSAVIATKTTQTGGEAVTQYVPWVFSTLDSTNKILQAGDGVSLFFTETGAASSWTNCGGTLGYTAT
jgi:hypothetical protein